MHIICIGSTYLTMHLNPICTKYTLVNTTERQHTKWAKRDEMASSHDYAVPVPKDSGSL